MKRFFCRWAPGIPFLIASVVLAMWVQRYGPHWPSRDGFLYFEKYDALVDGKLSVAKFLSLKDNEHPIAFQIALASLFLKAFPGSVWSLMVANAVFLWGSAIILYAAVVSSITDQTRRVMLAVLVCAAILIGSQAGSLLWEFQLWFYCTLLLLALNILLVERRGLKLYPVVFLCCLLASGNEAQGTFLWLVSGLHVFHTASKRDSLTVRRVGCAILIAHVAAFLSLMWVLLHGHYGGSPDHRVAVSVVDRIVYGIALVGGGSGVQNPSFSFVFGLLSMATWAIGTAFAVRHRFSSAIYRVAFLTTGLSLLWMAAFAIGRASFGIEWAFGEFHASQMMIPFYAGIGMYAVAITNEAGVGPRVAAACLSAVCVAPVFTGIHFALDYSRFMKLNSLLAAAAECTDSGSTIEFKTRISGLGNMRKLYSSVVERHRDDLCSGQKQLNSGAQLLAPPGLFQQLSSGDIATGEALHDLWLLYLERQDVREAFPITDSTTPRRLLRWASGEAASGSTAGQGIFVRHADALQRAWGLVRSDVEQNR
ncbi:hypothetical protein [Caballeronia sp. S22]|uniref:hypothetical protein n=1 Tax=Caballeronia sp. S22 TaxID=3137182 RepID=UPI0035306E93